MKSELFASVVGRDGDVRPGMNRSLETSPGVFLHVQSTKPGSLLVTGDTWGRAPLFYREHEGSGLLSSRLGPWVENAPELQEDPASLQELTARGFLSKGRTPLLGVRKLEADQALLWENDVWQIRPVGALPKKWFQEKATEEKITELLFLLRKATIRFVENGASMLALSGGCDSRLVLALLPEELRRGLTLYTKKFPALSRELDNDVAIAQELARKAGVSLQIVDEPKSYAQFLLPEIRETCPLSGLYGGEFLGGAFPHMLSEDFEKPRTPEELREFFLATMQTSRALFYESTHDGWASPYSMFPAVQSPFLDPDFLAALVRLDFEDWKDYRLYDRIWKRPEFQDWARIPFQSFMTEFFPYPRRSEGRNPKIAAGHVSTPLPKEKKARASFDSFLKNINSGWI